GVLSYHAKEFFTAFTWIVTASALAGAGIAVRDLWKPGIRLSLWPENSKQQLPMLVGAGIFASFVIYAGLIVYSHPIFEEYDSMYLYLPIAKSILLGNGLNHDYFGGSDVAIRSPPFVQSIDAWIIYQYGYSSLRLFPVYFVFFAAVATYLL